MKTISTALKTHLQGETTTLAWLWKVTRQDSQVFGFTTHDSDISLSGITYAAATGMLASAAQAKTGASVDNMEMAGMLDSAAITDADVLAGDAVAAAIGRLGDRSAAPALASALNATDEATRARAAYALGGFTI